MKKVFVDVDDTLILFVESEDESAVGVGLFGRYNPNYPLIERLKKFDGQIIVWSGGGTRYAEGIASKVLPRDMEYIVATKFDNLVESGDIIVDDSLQYFYGIEDLGVKLYGPHEDWE